MSGSQPEHLRALSVLKSGSLKPLEPSEPVQVCIRIALPLLTLLRLLITRLEQPTYLRTDHLTYL